jgi:hypothetical protein
MRFFPQETQVMLKRILSALSLTTCGILSEVAMADPNKFDGTWSVQLVASSGMCGSGASQTLTVQDGYVRAGGSGLSVSGQVAPSGSVSLALQTGPAQGTASGKLAGASGSGTWMAATLTCPGS